MTCFNDESSERPDQRSDSSVVQIQLNGCEYTGALCKGYRHGFGKIVDGSSYYEGGWYMGLRSGFGKMVSSSVEYSGKWKDGKRNGFGRMKSFEGICWGTWLDDTLTGAGCVLRIDHKEFFRIYSGELKDGNPNGKGAMVWLNKSESIKNEILEKFDHFDSLPAIPDILNILLPSPPTQQMLNRYVGEWREGLRHGPGNFYYADGSIFRGNWQNGEKSINGVFTEISGKIRGASTLPPSNPLEDFLDISDIFALKGETALTESFHSVGDFSDRDEKIEKTLAPGHRKTLKILLSALSALREIYNRYRKNSLCSTDPGLLRVVGFWAFLRDAGLIEIGGISEVVLVCNRGNRNLSELHNGGDFWNPFGSNDPFDANRGMLFRHFLEALVRVCSESGDDTLRVVVEERIPKILTRTVSISEQLFNFWEVTDQVLISKSFGEIVRDNVLNLKTITIRDLLKYLDGLGLIDHTIALPSGAVLFATTGTHRSTISESLSMKNIHDLQKVAESATGHQTDAILVSCEGIFIERESVHFTKIEDIEWQCSFSYFEILKTISEAISSDLLKNIKSSVDFCTESHHVSLNHQSHSCSL